MKYFTACFKFSSSFTSTFTQYVFPKSVQVSLKIMFCNLDNSLWSCVDSGVGCTAWALLSNLFVFVSCHGSKSEALVTATKRFRPSRLLKDSSNLNDWLEFDEPILSNSHWEQPFSFNRSEISDCILSILDSTLNEVSDLKLSFLLACFKFFVEIEESTDLELPFSLDETMLNDMGSFKSENEYNYKRLICAFNSIELQSL